MPNVMLLLSWCERIAMLRQLGPTLIIVVACLALSGCDGGISAEGHVRDENGKPIKGALVSLISRGKKDERMTGGDGAYDVGVITRRKHL